MGNTIRLTHYIDSERVTSLTNSANDQLLNLFMRYKGRNYDRMPLINFSLILNGNINDKFFKKFCHLFAKKDKVSFEGMKTLYAIFKSQYYRHKIGLITELIFGKRNTITELKYKSRLSLFFDGTEFIEMFLDRDFINVIKDTKARFSKKRFLTACEERYRQFFVDFIFLKQIVTTSEYIEMKSNNADISNVNYFCNCLEQEIRQKEEEQKEEIPQRYNQMKYSYNNLTSDTNYFLFLDRLEKLFITKQIPKGIIDVIIKYFKRLVGKNFILFDNLKDFFVHFDPSYTIDDKLKYIFELLAYPQQKVSKNDVYAMLEIDNKNIELFSSKIDFDEFKKIVSGEILIKINTIIDQIKIIPYTEFGMTPYSDDIKRLLLKQVLNDVPLDEYMRQYIATDKYFYLIEINYWNAVTGIGTNDEESHSRVNNSIFLKNGVKLDPEFKYKKDFVLVPKTLYSEIKNYFRFDMELRVDKRSVELNPVNIETEYYVNEEEGYIYYKANDKESYEIDLYQVGCFFFPLWEVVATITKIQQTEEVTVEEFNNYMAGKYILQDVMFQYKGNMSVYGRRQTFQYARDNLNLNKEIEYHFYTFYDGIFKLAPMDKTFEEMKILNYCMVFVDRKNKDGVFYYDTLSTQSRASILPKSVKENEEKKEEKKDDKKEDKKSEDKKKEEEKKEEELTEEMKKKIKEKEKEAKKIMKEQEEINRKIQKEREAEQKRIQKEQEEIRKKLKKEEDEKILETPFGLVNMGNTCYFNSVTQMFLNLPPLQNLYFNPKFKFFFNLNNKFGQKGKFIQRFLKLFKQNRVTLVDKLADFRKLVGKMNEQFDNNEQQDANEYLVFLLEAFHEELNLKNERKYIVNKDLLNLSQEEKSNVYWANAMRRSASFINSLFMFQLKSNLQCSKCLKEKYSFETNYIMDVPISLVKMIKVDIILYRLPCCYKFYYDQISQEFDEYNKAHPENSKYENLKNFSIASTNEKASHKQLFMMSIPLKFTIDIERNKKLSEILTTLKNIPELMLEPNHVSKDVDEISTKAVNKEEVNDCTSFAITNNPDFFLDPNSEIETYLSRNDTITFFVYEMLNAKGMNELLFKQINEEKKEEEISTNVIKNSENNCPFELIKYQIKPNVKLSEEAKSQLFINNNKTKDTILSVDMALSLNQKKNKETSIEYDLLYHSPFYREMVVPIAHYHADESDYYFFNKIHLAKVNMFPRQFLIVNNSKHSFTAKDIYQYVYDINSVYLKVPNENLINSWWNNKDSIRKCYPFVIRITEKKGDFVSENPSNYSFVLHTLKCASCPWYKYCPGCPLDPFSTKPIEFKPNQTIIVDWCNSIVQDGFLTKIFQMIYNIDSEKIQASLNEKAKKEDKTLSDCISLFLAKEKLEDELFCDYCHNHQYFYKNYEISKLPHILIISLKRFKYTEFSRHKLTNFIRYPINGMELKDKKYNLFGVVNHYGGIGGGHYTSIVRSNDKWFTLDDSHVYEINESNVVHSNAYMLFYISDEKPEESNDYYRLMMSMMENIQVDGNNNLMKYEEEDNLFAGEPVMAKDYGCGYVVKDYVCKRKKKEENNMMNVIEGNKEKEYEDQIIEVQFDYGKGYINRKNIIKETVLSITNSA